MTESPFAQSQAFFKLLGDGPIPGTVKLPPMQEAHYPVSETALAACLATLGIPFRITGPYSHEVDAKTGQATTFFWLGAVATHELPENKHETEQIFGAWEYRERFEAAHPFHPLVSMRAVLDARAWWLARMFGGLGMPHEVKPGERSFSTQSLHSAAILKALGFPALAFSGRTFYLARTHGIVHAEEVIRLANRAEGGNPAQWMHRVLGSFDELVRVAKATAPIIREQFGEQTLLLTADSTAKTRDLFFNQID